MLVVLTVTALVVLLAMAVPASTGDGAGPPPCATCGIPTLSSDGLCARCRAMAGAPGSRRGLEVDDEGRIAEDVSCRGCGYNLRGNRIASMCPECAVPVVKSIGENLLVLCDPHWVARLARGVLLVVVGIVIAVVVGVVIGITVSISATRGTAVAAQVMTNGRVLIVLAWGVYAYGVWLATSPDPGEVATPRLDARRLARWCVVAQFAGYVIDMVVGMTGLGAQGTFAGRLLIAVIGFTLASAGIVGAGAGLVHLARLLDRAARMSLARQCRIVMGGFVIGQGASLVGQALSFAAVTGLGRPLGCFFGVVAFVFGLGGVIVLVVAGGALSEAAEEARKRWRTGSA